MNCHAVFNCVGHNHELSDNRLIKETVLKYVNEAEFKELFTIAALEKIETITSSAIAATSSAIKASLDARNAINDLTAQTIDFVNDAINNTAIEGGVITDTFVVVDGNQTQRELNQKTARIFNNVSSLISNTKLKNGQYVRTLGYHNISDSGGATYLISDSPTDYSIPLANNLHAVFSDTFDIRKFGVVDSPTKNQSPELLRMRNYADTREYVIDFHGFSIMAPNTNANINNGPFFANVRGLWFDKVHHIKNLSIYADKVNRQTTGNCLIIFCPSVVTDAEAWFQLENVRLDPWSANYQPFTENYQGHYDGMRHGFFCHPKNGWGSLFSATRKDYATNYSFRFKDVEFLSSAYSYNITVAGLRSRTVEVDGHKGDSLLAVNLDCVNLYVRNFTTNTRYDLLESGRLMVMSGLHYEAEHSGAAKQELIFNYENIYLENCSITQVTRGGVQEKSGQLLWFTAIGKSYIRNINIKNSLGNVEIQGVPFVTDGTMTLNCDNVLIKDCLDSLWFGVSRYTAVKNITYDNSVIAKLMEANSALPSMVSDSKVDKFVISNKSVIKRSILNSNLKNSKVGELILDRVVFDVPLESASAIVQLAEVDKIVLSNCTYPRNVNLFRLVYNLKTLNISNVIFTGTKDILLLAVRYSDALGKTNATLDNVIFTENVSQYTTFNMAGTVQIINYTAPTVMKFGLPIDISGEFTAGINTIETNLYHINSPELNKSYTLTDSVAANSSVKKTYAVNKDCKDIALTFSVDLPIGISVSKYRYADTYVVVFVNNTTEDILLGSLTMAVKQII